MEENTIKKEEINNKNTYQCKECGLHYKDKELAEKCEVWCKEHKTCNVEITMQAEESKKENPPNLAKSETSSDSQGELEKKCQEYLNNWKRERADFLNYKKEEMERMAILASYAKESMILKILPILDNIVLAEKQLPEKLKKGKEGTPQSIEWTKGFLQIQKQITEFLKKEGIEEIETIGKKFDPHTMEIIEEVEKEGDSDIVIEELQKGYIMNDKILRPAKVKITK
jgi:molecular chaperone GrpE